MRIVISHAGCSWTIIPENDVERRTLAEALGDSESPASFYAETESVVYGITDQREDGRVTIGKHGDPPRITINIF